MAIIGTARYGINGYGGWREHPERDDPGNILWFLQIDLDGDGQFDSRVLPPSLRGLEFFRGVRRRDDPRGFGASQPEEESFSVDLVDLDGSLWAGPELSGLVNMTGGRMARLMAVSTTTRLPAQAVFTGTLQRVEYDPQTRLIRFRGSGLAGLLSVGTAAEVRDSALPFNAPESAPFISGSGAPLPIRHWRGQAPGTDAAACAGFILDACAIPINWSVEADPTAPLPEFFTLTGGSAWNALRAVCAAFALRAEFGPSGALYLRRLARETARLAVSGTDLTLEYSPSILPSPDVFNRLAIRVRPLYCPPYQLPIPLEEYGIAWSAAGPLAVPAGESLVLDIRFRKTEGSVFAANFTRVNGDSPLEPDPLIVNSQVDKNGVNMGEATGSGEASFELVSATTTDPLAPYPLYTNYPGWQDQARMILRNTSQTHTAYFFNLRLYAAGLSQRVEASLHEVDDSESQSLFGGRSASLRNPLIQTPAFAAWLGREYLDYFREPKRAGVTRASRVVSGDQALTSLAELEPGTLVDLPFNANLPNGIHRVLGSAIRWLNPTGKLSRHEVWLEKAPAPQVRVESIQTCCVNNQASLHWSHPGGLITGGILLVAVSMRSWGSVTSVSADGQALNYLTGISLGFPTNGDYPRVELWGAPSAGTAGAISVYLSEADWAECASILVSGMNPQNPFGELISLKAESGDPLAGVELGEGDLLVCAAGFQQVEPPVCSTGNELYAITSDGNWRGAAATASGLRGAEVGWNGVTGGFALVGVVLNALWHHEN